MRTKTSPARFCENRHVQEQKVATGQFVSPGVAPGTSLFIRAALKTPDWSLKTSVGPICGTQRETQRTPGEPTSPGRLQKGLISKQRFHICTKLSFPVVETVCKLAQLLRTLMWVRDQLDLVPCVVTRIARLNQL